MQTPGARCVAGTRRSSEWRIETAFCENEPNDTERQACENEPNALSSRFVKNEAKVPTHHSLFAGLFDIVKNNAAGTRLAQRGVAAGFAGARSTHCCGSVGVFGWSGPAGTTCTIRYWRRCDSAR